jgi:putative ABC transport system permease protein
MKQNYLLIALRNMMKNKLFILINVLGMGVAIAQCIVGYFAYDYDASFDAVHENRERVYRVSAVREFENKITKYGYASLPMGDLVDKTFTDVNHSSRYHHSFSNFKLADNLFPANINYVDPEFFQLFSFGFIAGSASQFKDKANVLLSEKVAIRLFGGAAAAMGKSITQVFGQELKEVQVAGVFKDAPMNSSFYNPDGAAYLNFENFKDEYKDIREDDWKVQTSLFLRIDDESRVSMVSKQLQPFIANNNKVREDFQIREFVLDPLSEMAHRDRAASVRSDTWGAPPISAVIGSNVMGILVLLLACFNLTNTSIATSARRLKEIGIRKVMGSSRTHLIFQFIGETMSICLLAAGVGLLLSDFFTVHGWNVMWQYFQLTPDYLGNTKFLLFLFGMVLFTGFVAGSYPAFYISKFNPVAILKGKLQFGGTNYFTRVLLGLQFSIALISIVCAIGFIQNARYQRDYDLGFNPSGSVVAWVSNQSEFDTYRNALQSNPSIVSMAGAKSGIFTNRINDPVKHESKQLEVDIIEVGDNYLSTLELKLLEGRDFVKDSETDRKESVIITQKMANAFGWDKPLGKEIIWRDTVKLYVVGVVKDVYTVGVWRELEPMMIRYVLPDQYRQLVASASVEDVVSVNTFMKEVWSKVFPNRLYNGRRIDEETVQVEEVNTNIVYMFGFMGAITLLLSATGLFTLVSLNIIKRMKEIGVRKVLGASVANITRIVNTEFIIILALASVLGSWGGYIQSDLIMGSIWKYYQAPGAPTIVISISILFVISFLAIGYKIYKTATMNPVESLKEE